MPPLDWMLSNTNLVMCFSRSVSGPRDLASEFLLLCVLDEDKRIQMVFIAHVDTHWPAGTWDGLLTPEDYTSKEWCLYPERAES